jgi:putative ABC transport system permease protein
MTTLWQDLRYGARMLVKNPGFTLIAVITLALGIGANTAIFSVVNAVLFKPLLYPGSERLVQLFQIIHGRGMQEADWWSYPKFELLRDQNRSFETVAGYTTDSLTITGGEEPERLAGEFVSASYFPLLGVRAVVGRTFNPEEDRTQGTHPVVLIGHALWQRRFGTDPQITGKTLTMGGKPYTITGVLPASFRGQQGNAEWWVPMMMREPRWLADAGTNWVRILARLKPNVPHMQAQTEMESLAHKMAGAFPLPPGWGREGIRVRSLKEARTGLELKNAFVMLLAAAGFVLLIACANTANLLLARAMARRQEMAVRVALGASRWRLMRQLLTESMLLSILGGAVGAVVAAWLIDLLTGLEGSTSSPFWRSYNQMLRLYDIGLDRQILLFNLSISLVTGLLFGLAPAFGASRGDVNEALKSGSGGAPESFRRRRLSLRGALVVAEVAMAVVLLAGAGLMVRSLVKLQTTNHGFDPTGVTTFSLDARNAKLDFFNRLRERIAALPGVETASLSRNAPLSGVSIGRPMKIQGRPDLNNGIGAGVGIHNISPEYLPTFRIPLSRGRNFTSDDRAGGKRVAIVSETAARRFWPGADPLGALISVDENEQWVEVVGVVADVKYWQLEAAPSADVYIPHTQHTARPPNTLSVRGTTAKAALASAVRREVAALDRNIPLTTIRTIDERFTEATAQMRYGALLLVLFAGLALIISQMGVYGVITYAVSSRTQEIGIRMALGAQRRDVFKLVVGQGMMLAMSGLAIGLAASFGLTRLIKSMLYGISTTDAVTFMATALLLTAVAILACYIPARRATKVDPIVALRYE